MNIYEEIVKGKSEEILRKAVLPSDKQKAENWKRIFLSDLAGKRYESDKNGQVVIYDEAGFECRDEHGNNLTLDQVVQKTFDKYFEISDLPVTPDECLSRLKDEKITVTDRKRITDQLERLQTKIVDYDPLITPTTPDQCLMALKDPKITPEKRKEITELWEKLKT